MKKLLGIALALCLLVAALPVTAAAYEAVLSPQYLAVDGRCVNCEKYNIDGYNYFKLRDLAYLLSGTPVQFDVSYDAETNSVTIAPGFAYTAVGGELEIGADKAAGAVPTAQAVWFLDAPVDDVSIYNIGGNNYFKLRDLGELLGFAVDYDAESNTALVFSGAPALTEAEAQARAFDALWAWVDGHYDDALDGDKFCELYFEEWETGEAVAYYLLNTVDAGRSKLLLLGNYLFPDGAVDATHIYLDREAREYRGVYHYYVAGNDSDAADFEGLLTLRADEYDINVPVTFETVTEDAGEENIAAAAKNAGRSFGYLLHALDDYCWDTPLLSPVAAVEDFGFVHAQLHLK
jgi:hypothetical protein